MFSTGTCILKDVDTLFISFTQMEREAQHVVYACSFVGRRLPLSVKADAGHMRFELKKE